MDVSGNNGQPSGELRLIALERAGGTEYKVCVPPIPRGSNWVQIGPTALPGGGTISTYYSWYRKFSSEKVYSALATGRVTTIVVDPTDPKIIYLGTAQGGVWKTKDGGRNWIAKSDYEISLSIGALAIDPKNPLVLYAGTGEGNFSQDSYYGNGILKTTDGGETWKNYARDIFKLSSL